MLSVLLLHLKNACHCIPNILKWNCMLAAYCALQFSTHANHPTNVLLLQIHTDYTKSVRMLEFLVDFKIERARVYWLQNKKNLLKGKTGLTTNHFGSNYCQSHYLLFKYSFGQMVVVIEFADGWNLYKYQQTPNVVFELPFSVCSKRQSVTEEGFIQCSKICTKRLQFFNMQALKVHFHDN